MEIYETQAEIAKRQNWLLSLVVIVLITFGVLAVLQALTVVMVTSLFDLTLEDLTAIASGNYKIPNGRMAMLVLQGLVSGLGFCLSTWVIIRFVEKANLHWERQLGKLTGKNALFVLIIAIGGIAFNGLLVYWNSLIDLPEFLSEVETWMKQMEDQLMELTKFLTDFQSIPELLSGILVIGVLAAVGEELFFRGMIQPKMNTYFKSAHWGIWITAFIFSAIHVQFYGFFPRLFLGALFGYLYHFSGSLFYPILGHFFNNTLTLLMVYLSNQGQIEFDLESTDTVSYPAALGGLLVLILGFLYFKKSNMATHGKLD